MTSASLDRRKFLHGTVGAALASAGAGTLLSGCSTDNGNSSTESDSSSVKLPDFQPSSSVKPDLPGDNEGVLDGFLAYPKSEATADQKPPGSGGSVTALLELGTVPPAVDKNTYWQELNKRMGADFVINGAPATTYQSKLTTVLAGNDLPDLVQIQPMPRLAQALRAQFQDLTEFLSGDKVKKYPALASLPTQGWKNTTFDGGIFGVPYPQGAIGNLMLHRADIIKEKGLTDALENGEDLLELCKALTEPQRNRWAHGYPLGMLDFVSQMTGAPNVWAESGGQFTNAYETEQFREALDIVARMWKEGYFHPDSFISAEARARWFGNGTVALSYNGYSVWSTYLRDFGTQNPTFDLGALVPAKWDGGGRAPEFLNRGIYTFTAMKKANASRVDELLRIMNWLATPFGTPEHRFRKYGIEGVHHTISDGEPVLTDKGTAEIRVPIYYVGKESPVLYEPGQPDETRKQYDLQKLMIPGGVRPANVGLTSDTESVKGAQLDKPMKDLQSDVIQGRKTLSDWDAAVKTWKSEGGDLIRKEYAESLEG